MVYARGHIVTTVGRLKCWQNTTIKARRGSHFFRVQAAVVLFRDQHRNNSFLSDRLANRTRESNRLAFVLCGVRRVHVLVCKHRTASPKCRSVVSDKKK